MKVVLLVGLPGSGKTYLGKEIVSKNDATIFVDDITGGTTDGQPNFNVFKDFLTIDRPWKECYDTIVVADVFLCEADCRKQAIETIKELDPKAEIEWIFFENNPEACRKNVARRADGREVEGTLTRFAKTYTIPPGARVERVYNDV